MPDEKNNTRPNTTDPHEGSVVDRRSGLDRRDLEGTSPTNLERRRGPGRRLSDFVRDAEEGEMNKEQFMFLMAIDAFKRSNGKSFPTWTDVLEVIRKLGYRKTMPTELNLGGRVEDWRERADAPSNTTHSTPQANLGNASAPSAGVTRPDRRESRRNAA